MPVPLSERPIAATAMRPAIGRFAPSPTGNLHLGSLTTAIASYCHIKSLGGQWLVRMEDTDTQRCFDEYSSQILVDIERLGLHWDDQVIYQSKRQDIYNELLHSRLSKRLYACSCSRKQLQGYATYPRFCLANTYLKDSTRSNQNNILKLHNKKVRVQLPDYTIGFLDQLQGMQWVNPQQQLGDVVLRRADSIVNYFLAVSVDDGLQGVTHVMRGLDILPLTTAQIALMDYLGLPAIERWYHLPLVENHQGQKLSKQNLAEPIDTRNSHKCQQLIKQALALLNQPKVAIDTPQRMLMQAVEQWQNQPLMNQTSLGRV